MGTCIYVKETHLRLDKNPELPKDTELFGKPQIMFLHVIPFYHYSKWEATAVFTRASEASLKLISKKLGTYTNTGSTITQIYLS